MSSGTAYIQQADSTASGAGPANPGSPQEQDMALDTLLADSQQRYGLENYDQLPVRTVETPPEQPEIISQPAQPVPLVVRNVEVENWQTVLLLITFFLLAFVKAFNSTRFHESVKALFNYDVAEEIVREEKVFFHQVNLITTLIHLITVSLLIFYMRGSIAVDLASDFTLYLFIVVFVCVLYLMKYTVSKVLFFVFNDIGIANEYIFNVSLYNGLLGSALIPVLSLLYFTPFEPHIVLNYLLVPLLLLVFSWRLLRLFVIGKEKGISYFYIFLYICTLEILPLVVLYRIFILK
ncbi:MAG: DUF4271 domain-containing protein [Flavobacteriales bacterium]|nr:DUF4271 domain-containing protein [Flavobacteriales bacterium]